MRIRAALAVAAAGVVLVAGTAAGSPQYQAISLDAASGDSSVGGHAQLVVTKDHGAFRVRGSVTSYSGCVTLKAVQEHIFGTYFGGTTMAHVCGSNHHADVDSRTHHSHVVLTADIGPGYDSPIVELTGTGG